MNGATCQSSVIHDAISLAAYRSRMAEKESKPFGVADIVLGVYLGLCLFAFTVGAVWLAWVLLRDLLTSTH